MQFTFDEEQQLAARALRELLADLCQGSDLRRAAQATDLAAFVSVCAERRERLAELGLAGALVPAEQGGLGLSSVDFVLLAEEAGRAALPEPLTDTAGVAHPLLASLCGDGAVEGSARAAMLLAESIEGRAMCLAALPGTSIIAGAPLADGILTGATDDEVCLYEAKDCGVVMRESVDPLRKLGELRRGSARPVAALRGARARALWADARARSMVFNAAQLIGLAARMNEIAVAYALERKQFGRAIGSNQAVKHLLADVMVKVEFARPVVYAAAASLAPVRVAHAAVAAADAADRAARAAIQVHGAMGYSWEVDLQFYAKRAWALAGLEGGRSAHFGQLHDRLLRGDIALGPDRLFDIHGSLQS